LLFLVSSANASLRETTDDMEVPIIRPETSRIAKRRLGKKESQDK